MTNSPFGPDRIAVISANSGWNILNFRQPIITALQAAGWTIVAMAPPDEAASKIGSLGIRLIPIRIDSSGTSVLRDARLFLAYRRALRRLRPTAFLGFTVKPNIYGSLAAAGLGIRVINNISGLGTAFLRGGPLGWLVRGLYRLALRRSARVFFQNPDDLDLFAAGRLVREEQARLLPGSGIDLQHFQPASRPSAPGRPFRFLFVGR
ncbi:MAG TPA: glycosyltransferase, partial [Sphingomicrobium sp.]|nr:glycosyltransferase [Sphingomicrobium sp.]